MKGLTAWIAVAAVVLHALLPGLMQSQAGARSSWIEVCGQLDIQKIAVSSAASPDTADPSNPDTQKHPPVCPVCSMASAVALPPALLQWFFTALQAAAPPVMSAAVSHRPDRLLPAPPRAPSRILSPLMRG